MKVKPAYRCMQCDKVFTHENSDFEIEYYKLPELLFKVVVNQNFMFNPALYKAPLYIPHKCKDGSCGLAIFAGFAKCN